MFKKIYFVSALIFVSILPITASANDANTYQTEKFKLEKKYDLSNDKPEVIDDLKGIASQKFLVPKTNAKFEIAISNNDGSFTFLEAKNSYDEALDFINSKKSSKEILSIINNEGRVIYSTLSMGRVIKHLNGKPTTSNNYISNVYTSSSLNNAHTYINHGYIDDVPILSDTGKVAKVQVAGYIGWLNKDVSSKDYDLAVVPLNHVTNPSYYYVSSNTLYHFISSDILSTSKKGHTLKIGPAPSYLNSNSKYYSYDGKYFFKSLNELILGVQSNNYSKSVNSSKPFYSYYQNLPFRSKSNYTSHEIDNYIISNTRPTSKLRGTGKYFVNAQNEYGVNALLSLGLAINESGFGESTIAKEKNNLFGLGAIDTTPGQSANYFKSVEDCINEFARYHISQKYANPDAWLYYGGHLGNKNLGANVKYASDPFWGEKASHHTSNIDSHLKGKDFNHYKLGTFKANQPVYNYDGHKLYDAKKDTPTILAHNRTYPILGIETTRILPERTSNKNLETGRYTWNVHGYSKSSNITVINSGKYSLPFSDIQGHFAQKQIEDFAFKGYTVGYSDGTFRPNAPITRAEFIKFINMSMGYTKMASENFVDVRLNDWFYNQVKIANYYKYISSSQTHFRPNDFITREEAAAILTNIKNNKDDNLDKLSKYKDKNNVSSWAKSSVEGAIQNGYMGNGSLYFRPKDNLTRGEAIGIISNALTN